MRGKGSQSLRIPYLYRRAAIVLGVLIALLGVGGDSLLPNSSPGLNLLLILAGLIVSFAAFQWRRFDAQTGLRRTRAEGIASRFVISIITLVVLEFVLTAAGVPPYYPAILPVIEISVSPWWTCDEPGCHYVYDAATQACDTGELEGRPCLVNRQGFPDTDEFVARDTNNGQPRILVLGDSFAFGMNADSGQSFVETLEAGIARRA